MILNELEKMGVHAQRTELLREKDGVIVARVFCGERTAVVKAFCREQDRREIENYRVLQALSVPTLRLFAATDAAILLEDVCASPLLRLGRPADLDDESVARALAQWYRTLHDAGENHVLTRTKALYSECDFVSESCVKRIIDALNLAQNPGWNLLLRRIEAVRSRIRSTPMTLTYNDFYYTNLAVAADASSALMFDYNLLGRGLAASDVRNVLSSLTPRAGAAFLAAYGPINPVEQQLDAVVSPVSSLYLALSRPAFPAWAQQIVDDSLTRLEPAVRRLTE